MTGEFKNDSLFVIFPRQGCEPIIQLTWKNQIRASSVKVASRFDKMIRGSSLANQFPYRLLLPPTCLRYPSLRLAALTTVRCTSLPFRLNSKHSISLEKVVNMMKSIVPANLRTCRPASMQLPNVFLLFHPVYCIW